MAEHYGARAAGGVLDGWLVDTADAAEVERVEAAGIACRAVPLMMTDLDATAAMAEAPSTSPTVAGDRHDCGALTCLPVDGVGEVRARRRPRRRCSRTRPTSRDGDVLVVTSKVVSKAEGRVVAGDREDALDAETDRVVARRGDTSIVRTRHGLVMAAAGIDASNTEPGTLVLLPARPGRARRAAPRARCTARPGATSAVLVTDTAGRAWRNGQTDIAIGAAGLDVLHDLRRAHRRATATSWRSPRPPSPTSWPAPPTWSRASSTGVRPRWSAGSRTWCCPPASTAPARRRWCAPRRSDMFGLGAREAVLRALPATGGPRGFGAPRRRRARSTR